MGEEEDSKAITAVKAMVYVLPLMLRFGFTVLKLKRRQKKKIKLFRRTLIKNGMEKETAERLSAEIPELRIREMVSEFGGEKIQGISELMNH